MNGKLVRLAILGFWLVLINRAFTQTWTQTSAPTNSWTAVAVSADAKRIVAVAGDSFNAWSRGIWISTNSGATWFETSAPSNAWTTVACSADGFRIVAAASHAKSQGIGAGPVCVSTNGGQTWQVANITERMWRSAACSADGSRMFIVTVFGELFTSTNSGTSWQGAPSPGGTWAITCSPAGNILLAGGGNAGAAACVSLDGGASWSTNAFPGELRIWDVALSSDGTRMWAVHNVPGIFSSSTNFGMTWETNSMPGRYWHDIASSGDGAKLVVADALYASGIRSGPIYTSSDSGQTWTSTDNQISQWWRGVASSADGSTMVAVSEADPTWNNGTGGIWILSTPSAPRLNIATESSGLRLSWLTPTTNFALQANLDLNTQNWLNVTNPSVLNLTNLHREVFLPRPPSNTFYRLSAP
jgi:hypothetical protein